MSSLHITVGIPASGKSTWSEYRAADLIDPWEVVSSDALRERLTGDATDQTKNIEVFGLMHELVAAHLTNDQSVLVDATNLIPAHRKSLLSIADMFPQTWCVVAHRFDIPFREAMRRNARRERVVPSDVMAKMHRNFRHHASTNVLTGEGWNVIEHQWDAVLWRRDSVV